MGIHKQICGRSLLDIPIQICGAFFSAQLLSLMHYILTNSIHLTLSETLIIYSLNSAKPPWCIECLQVENQGNHGVHRIVFPSLGFIVQYCRIVHCRKQFYIFCTVFCYIFCTVFWLVTVGRGQVWCQLFQHSQNQKCPVTPFFSVEL